MKKIFDFPDKFDITVSVASGVEKVLKSELERLNVTDYKCDNGAITFSGDKNLLTKCNILLRTADRVYIKIAEFKAESFDELFDSVSEVPWEEFITYDGAVYVNGKCVKSKLFSISDCQKIVKKSIVNRLCNKYGLNRLDEDGALYEVDFYIYKDICYLRLNTSGRGLHRRGYRDLVGIAPIKETLASALLLLSDFYYKRPFIDPFCGSGTIAIEAAMIALNIAPNICRRFDFNDWTNFENKYYDDAVTEALDNEKRDNHVEIYGSDIDKKAIALSMHHAERANLKDYIKFEVADVKNLKSNFAEGTIVTNPPYGERVFDRREAEECNKNLGLFKSANSGWSVFAISSANNFEKSFGCKADRKRKLYNAEKECNYFYFYGKRDK